MENHLLANKLKEIARIMALLGENQFKVTAFENGARTIDQMEEKITAIAERGNLEQIRGIGKGLAEVIREFLKNGSSSAHDELKQQVPSGILEILTLPGLGVKKVQLLWHELQITTVGELEYACTENRLLKLKGFGPKLQTSVLEAIQFRKRHANKILIDAATALTDTWLHRLSKLPSVQLGSVTGEVRRGNETIDALALLLAVDDKRIFEQELEGLLNEGEVISNSDPLHIDFGFNLDLTLHLCKADEFSEALHFHTGSAEHLKALDDRAVTRGYKYSHGQLLQSGKPLPTGSEESVYTHLDLAFHPPEIREGDLLHEEIPDLISADMIQGFFHAHSTWSDGMHSLREMLVAAYEAGYHYMGISEHSPAAFYAGGLSAERVVEQWQEIDELNGEWKDFTIFKGIESDILPDGSLDYPEEILQQFDFVIASIHNQFNLDGVKQTDRVIRALQSPYSTMLGHPTGRLLLSRDGYQLDMKAVIEAAAETGTLIEINCTAQRMDLDWRWLARAREAGVMVSINPDAHHINMIGTIPLGVKLARKGMLSSDDVLNTRSADEISKWFTDRKAGIHPNP